MIRTPDQRLRVFISSTLGELAAERKAAKEAIERLQLIPVLFESGARPHAPKEVYQAYLEQSQVFIGIYASQYGWVGPGMNISGLEDEFKLGASKPRLIYVKSVSENRDPRLEAMLATLRSEGSVSYHRFSGVEELSERVLRDLAIMLSERFSVEHRTERAAAFALPKLPALRGPSIGRDDDLARLSDLLLREETGLLTVTGPGGTGKSRVCLALAHHVQSRFADGALFVPLSSILDPGLVASAIATAIGSFDNMNRSPAELLKDLLGDKRMLLVLDNFEQILPAANLLTNLLENCPRLKILVSSRGPLHVRNERVYPLSPLQEPQDARMQPIAELLANPSVQLFMQRASDSSANVSMVEREVRAIGEICHKLDGIPLAIELAAAHSRMLPASALLDRMEGALALLDRGARDLPERQRTMRATIAWSHELLEEPTRLLFRRLAVMADRFTLKDAHAVCGGSDERATMDGLEQLVDQGLVRMFVSAIPGSFENTFSLLHLVREFAAELLDASGERAAYSLRHAMHISACCAEAEEELLLTEVGTAIDRIDMYFTDVRAAFWYWIGTDDRANAWQLMGNLAGYLSHRGLVSEALRWMEAAGIHPLQEPPPLPARVRGSVYTMAAVVLHTANQYSDALEHIRLAVGTLEGVGEDRRWMRAHDFMGFILMNGGFPDALTVVQRTVEVATRLGFERHACTSLMLLSEVLGSKVGDLDKADELLEQARPLAERCNPSSATAMFHLQRGNCAMLRENWTGAVDDLERSTAMFDQVRMLPVSAWAFVSIGYTHLMLGHVDRAIDGFSACLDRGRRTSAPSMIACAMIVCARLEVKRGDKERAARLFGAGQRMFRSGGYAPWSTFNYIVQRTTEEMQRALPKERLDAAIQEGEQLSKEAAIALTLDVMKQHRTAAGAIVVGDAPER